MKDPTSILDLFRQAADANREALDELLVRLQPALRTEISRLLARRPVPAIDSMDLAQTAVMSFLRCGPKFVPESESHVEALLRRIARNHVIDAQRREGRREDVRHVESVQGSASFSAFAPPARSEDRPGLAMEREDDANWVRLALQFLEPDDRHLLLAREIDGLEWGAIATELGLASGDAARVRCTRLKPRVARVLLDLRRGRLPQDG